ncbi:hypothetical protein Acsp02_75120 [Actinoplanes sp. NBRC 103695]|nr:hypothetical protein Acsp02_75120 [Actinoplanes sp. NBRC 103695]
MFPFSALHFSGDTPADVVASSSDSRATAERISKEDVIAFRLAAHHLTERLSEGGLVPLTLHDRELLSHRGDHGIRGFRIACARVSAGDAHHPPRAAPGS